MKNKNKIKQQLSTTISKTLEVPLEIVADIPKITMLDNKQLTIRNYKGIIEYESNKLRINTKSFIVKITGENLTINTIDDEDISVEGIFSGVSFE